jgi:alpha-tubulin suppressor-like RCC1 family protein
MEKPLMVFRGALNRHTSKISAVACGLFIVASVSANVSIARAAIFAAPGAVSRPTKVSSHSDAVTGPNSSLSANTISGYVPLNVSFDGSASSDSTGTLTSWDLSFGDGSADATGTGTPPSPTVLHLYVQPGTFTATLTVYDNNSLSNSTTLTISDNAVPQGNIYQWGVMLGSKLISRVPVLVAGLDNATYLDVGNNFDVVTLSNGTVMDWGKNSEGQLGNGTTTNSTTPVQVSGLTNAIETASGNEDAGALLRNGTVKTWGSNANGQLGIDSRTNSSVPVLVPGLKNVVQIAAAGGHMMALLSNGTVMTWGSLRGARTRSLVPRLNSSLSGVVALSAGDSFEDALLSNGIVMDWGSNNWGQLGNGTTTNSSVPVEVSGINSAVQISGGGEAGIDGHNVALLSNGTIVAWGQNFHGQLGNGTFTASSVPVVVWGINNAVSITAGGQHSMALLSNGIVMSWGLNGNGQLGIGENVTDSDVPVTIPSLSGVLLINAGPVSSLGFN